MRLVNLWSIVKHLLFRWSDLLVRQVHSILIFWYGLVYAAVDDVVAIVADGAISSGG